MKTLFSITIVFSVMLCLFYYQTLCNKETVYDESTRKVIEAFREGFKYYKAAHWLKSYSLLQEAWRLYNLTKPAKIREAQILVYLQDAAFVLHKVDEAYFLCNKILSLPHVEDKERNKVLKARANYEEWLEMDKKDNEQPTVDQIKEALKRAEIMDYALCKDETIPLSVKKSDLFCRYNHRNRHPLLLLSPIKEEFFSLDPIVVQFHDLVTTREIEMIKSAATHLLHWRGYGASLLTKTISEQFEGRKVKAARLFNFSLPSLAKRVEAYTGLNSYGEGAEVYQVSRYRIGGHFKRHFDSSNPVLGYSGLTGIDRIASLLLYLSEVEHGGSTIFDQLNVRVNPHYGSGLFFYNFFRNGSQDMRLIHAGCPVIRGEKWVANRFFRLHDQLWHKPCLLDNTGAYALNDFDIPKHLQVVKRTAEEFINPPGDAESW